MLKAKRTSRIFFLFIIFSFNIFKLCLAQPNGTIYFTDGKQVKLMKMGMNGSYFYGNQRINCFIMNDKGSIPIFSCEFVIDYGKKTIPVKKIDHIKILKIDRIDSTYSIKPIYKVEVALKNGKSFKSYMAITYIFGKLSDGSRWTLKLENNRNLWSKLKKISFK